MSELDIDSIRKFIAKRSINHIRDCNSTEKNEHLIFKTFCGSGKTTSIMKAVDEKHFNWMYFAPFHQIIVENLKFSQLRNYNFIHLKGRKQDGVCAISEFRKYAQQGLNITPFCESRCPLKNDGCEYYEIKKKIETFPQSWAGVHSHIPSYLQKYLYALEFQGKKMYNFYDVIIIDEFPFQVLYDQVICQKKDIDKLRDVIYHIPKDSDEKEFVKQVLDELSLATGTIDLNYTKLHSLMKNHRALDFDEFIRDYDETLLRLVSNEIVQSPPKKILYLIKQVHKRNPDRELIEWMIYKHKFDGWNPPGIYLTTSNIDTFRSFNIPVIALDATAHIRAWNALFNDTCEIEKIDIEYKNTYQMQSRARYPVRSWVDLEDKRLVLSDTGKRLADLIKSICARKTYDVLLCSNKRIQRLLKKYLSRNYSRNNYQFANYYNLRSRNSFYETCDTCVITHEPNIPPLQMNIIHQITGWEKDLLQILMTESEMLQAIGRIRQNIEETQYGRERENIEIFILPGTTYDSGEKLVDEAKLISYERMKDGNLVTTEELIKDMIKKAGVTSQSGLYKYCSDFCSKRTLGKILKKLWIEGYITDYKNVIEWDSKAEQERLRTKYIKKT